VVVELIRSTLVRKGVALGRTGSTLTGAGALGRVGSAFTIDGAMGGREIASTLGGSARLTAGLGGGVRLRLGGA
jgi:hypothetical protein